MTQLLRGLVEDTFMARARNIKPSFFTNDKLSDCGLGARLLFIGLWTLADREGRLDDNPRKIKAQLFPYEDADCDKWLISLHNYGFIMRYKVDNIPYIQIVNFKKHQNPHVKEQASTIPAPDMHGASMEVATPLTESLLLIPESPSPLMDRPKPKVVLANLSLSIFSETELQELCMKYPAVDFTELIETLKDWCLSKGKTYKDYKAAIRTWAKKEQGNKNGAIRQGNQQGFAGSKNQQRQSASEDKYAILERAWAKAGGVNLGNAPS